MVSKTGIHNFERDRGETFPFRLNLDDTASGSTFQMVANVRRDPSLASSNAFTIAGVIDPDDDTKVTFTPELADVLIDAGVYYFAIWQTTPIGDIRVSAKGTFRLNQGIPV